MTRLPQSALATMRRTAQIVFQNADSSLNPRKTVAEIVGRPLRRFAILPPAERGRPREGRCSTSCACPPTTPSAIRTR